MREYVIMTDSCCDLTDHMAKELELTVVPLTVHIDGHDYPNLLDGSAISFEDFYGKIRGGVLATTSAANVGQFQEAMRPILAAGKDIVSINFSSALSTTYQSACIAAQDMKGVPRCQHLCGGLSLRLSGPGPAALSDRPEEARGPLRSGAGAVGGG